MVQRGGMVAAFAILLVCQLAGEGLVHATGIPLPGPVVGLVLLALGLFLRGRYGVGSHGAAGEALSRVSDTLLGHLSLLFVPAAVGIVQQGPVLLAQGPALGLALLVSTLAALAVTAGVFAWAMRFTAGDGE